jgi:hypothetical protein
MTKEVDYNSLRERLGSLIKKTDTSYKRLIKAKRMRGSATSEEIENFPRLSPGGFKNEDLDKFETKRNYDYLVGEKLGNFNDSLLKGNFKNAEYSIKEINGYLNDSQLIRHYSKEEKEKLVTGINRRIERGIRYLEKNPEDKNIIYMKEILGLSKAIEDKLHQKESPSGLEKTITVVSMLSVVLGISIGYPALTGNVIAENVRGSMTAGMALFVVGLLGVFLANKK